MASGGESSNNECNTAALLLSSRVIPNVMKKDVGVILIRTLFQMEMKMELSMAAGLANAFCKWKLATSILCERQAMKSATGDEEGHLTVGTSADKGDSGASQRDGENPMNELETNSLEVERQPGFETSVLALDALYARLISETESMQKKLEELREDEEGGVGFEKAAGEGKVLLSIIYMRQSMKRQLRRAFDKWFFTHVRKSTSLANVKKLGTSLTLETHKTSTRQFHVARKLEQNETVGNAIECSHAFFRWKFAIVKVILQEERHNGERDRKKLFKALRELKALLYGKIRRNKAITNSSCISGDKLGRRINHLHSTLNQAKGLSKALTDLIDHEGTGEKVVLKQAGLLQGGDNSQRR
jgi:hypothetical protein